MIPVNEPLITAEDISNVSLVMQGGWISGDGPVIEDFQDQVAKSVGRKFGVAVSNGSDALDLAFTALSIPSGSEVIVPDFTIISCLLPLLRLGLTPVFLDVNEDDWNLDVRLLEEALTPKTKAILVVHTYGLASNFPVIEEFASKHGLWIVEDAAEAQGLAFGNKPCGSMGDVSTLSFYANKNVTTGEGGMVLTDNPELADRLKFLRNLTFVASERFVHREAGWNMRLSSIQAALGLSQLKRLHSSVARRREIAALYKDALGGNPALIFQADRNAGGENGYWVVGVCLRGHPKLRNAKEAMTELAQAGVGTRPFFYPLHKQPLLQGRAHWRTVGTMENAEYLAENGFYLPNGLGTSPEKILRAVELATEVLGS